MPEIKAMIAASHNVGALTFIDAVQYVPHCLTDVQALDCDFLACSAYKFFGPHQGILYGKRNVLPMFQPRKVRPAKNIVPYSWETGTQCHELLAGVTAAVDYLAAISDDAKEPGTRADLRSRLVASFHDIREWEQQLSAKVLATLGSINGLQLYGITDCNHLHLRVPTFAFTVQGFTPREVAGHLAARSVYCWSGNYYAVRLMEALGLEEAGGAVRIGLEHLNTFEEIDYLAECLTDLMH
jgi:selenocysteine lyase/cysteine desulfurase